MEEYDREKKMVEHEGGRGWRSMRGKKMEG